MANKKHVVLVKQGLSAWNAWRYANPSVISDLCKVTLSRADLSGADLTEANLSGATLRWANLEGANLIAANLSDANLRGANLASTDLSGADLSGADLSDADLLGANLSDADLRRADLSRAELIMADLSGADLSRANLSRVILLRTKLANNDLSTVKGLETVNHEGPSSIGIDTLFKSNGKIPEVFLRGTGVPEDFITQIPSLIVAIHPIQFHSCFISYSHQDEQFSQRLHSRMRDEKLRVWYAREDMKGGRKLHEEIFSAIQIHDKLLLVLSESSMKSEWVMTEIRRARKVEREESRRKLFPIRLVDFETIKNWECFDADSGKDLAVELREYYIPDFSNWKDHDAFEAEFSKLLRDLRATET
jgi:hypothetical protein